jgi:hypothetical protein
MGVAGWFALSFYATARYYPTEGQPYEGWWITQAETEKLPANELVFGAKYLAFGLILVACLALGLYLTGISARLPALFHRLRRERQLPLGLVLVVVLTALLIRRVILLDEVVTDDENVYLYTARTLLHGRLVNPLPDAPGFFWNIFVVSGPHGAYGKYPIGHPLVVALALLLHLEDALFPVLGGLTAWLTWKLGRLVVGPRRAFLALLFLVISPQFTWTHATLLSQTTTCLALVAGTLLLLQAREHGNHWFLLAGAVFGFGCLARPLPGGFFALVAVAWILLESRTVPRKAIRESLLFCIPVVAAVLMLLAVNWRQTGHPFRSGYHEVHGALGAFGMDLAQVGESVVGAIWRQNFWLLGWPLSFAFLPFARGSRAWLLLWGAIAAELAYRIIVPKTVVDATGPIYMMEIVPFLAILSADGVARFATIMQKLAPKPSVLSAVAAFAVASTIAAAVLFVPVQLRTLAASARARHRFQEAVDETGEKQGIVFANNILANKETGWAYFPPSPDPDLKDDWLYLRWPPLSTTARTVAIGYWKSHYPDRPAFIYHPGANPPLERLK